MCKVKTKVAGEAAVDAQPAGLTPLTSAFLSCFHTYIDERETLHSVYEVGNVRHHSECAIRKRWISIFHKQPKPVLWAINQAAFSVISVLLLGSDSALSDCGQSRDVSPVFWSPFTVGCRYFPECWAPERLPSLESVLIWERWVVMILAVT